MRSIRWLAAGVLCLTASACFRPESTTCSGGQVCPPGFVCSADGTQCITDNALCGNGKIDALPDGGMEACDDGNVLNEPSGTPNACRADCTGTGSCGDGRVDDDLHDLPDGGAREVCDPGLAADGELCELDCQSFKGCGNHVVDDVLPDGGFEVCDDGNTLPGDGCSADCRSNEKCGNGVTDVRSLPDGGNELCDDGNTTSGDGCRNDCLGVEVCGDGFTDAVLRDGGFEECDDRGIDDDLCNAQTCRIKRCGDGHLDQLWLVDGGLREQCDLGAADAGGANGGVSCSVDCMLRNCGNGIKDIYPPGSAQPDGGGVDEECDYGLALNGTAYVGPDGLCNNACRLAACGNGVSGDLQVDGGFEPCDEGFQANGDAGSLCGPTCQLVACGNGVTDWNEACDDGNNVSGDGCSANCQSNETCGNGTRDLNLLPDGGGEICDDGNRDAGDGCSEICTSEVCGDLHKDPIKADGGSEACDDPAGNNGTVLSNCGPTCLLVACGNGVIDTAWLEVCDDGNTDPVGTIQPDGGVDNCASDCRSTGSCGNNVIDTSVGEQCDNGAGNNVDTLLCTSTCKLAYCGDALVLDGGEQCDDGRETFGCNLNCTLARCGDGVVNATRGEQCDVQDAGVGPYETTTCDLDCTVAFCGDGTVNARRGELCDTAGNSGTCDSDCTPNVCGDTFLNPFAKPDGGVEQCDTGGNTAFCDSDCTARVCGDGFTNDAGGEFCDDGNTSENDNCLNNCKLNTCGDGKQNIGVEQCDDGTASNTSATVCPYGYATCNLCNLTCHTVTGSSGGVCGDGTPNTPNEACDFGNALNGASSCPYSTSGTCTGCSANCQAQYSLTGPKCGDGRVDALPDGGIEACDDGSLGGNDGCASCVREPGWTFTGTSVGQTTVATPICGDSLRVGNEACDEGAKNGTTDCAYGTGNCSICNASCTATVTGTAHRCGDAIVDALPDGGTEACDDGNNTTEASCPYNSPGCAACNSTCTQALSLDAGVCGDGVKNTGFEACDDRNANTCGTCSSDCSNQQLVAAASALVTFPAGSALYDGGVPTDGGAPYEDVFTLNDGATSVTFCFKLAPSQCTSGSVTPISVTAGTSAKDVAGAVITAVGNNPILIYANRYGGGSSPIVLFTNANNGSAGNTAITSTDNFLGPVAMTGGGGNDCAIGVGCNSNADCVSNNCNNSTHKCQ